MQPCRRVGSRKSKSGKGALEVVENWNYSKRLRKGVRVGVSQANPGSLDPWSMMIVGRCTGRPKA